MEAINRFPEAMIDDLLSLLELSLTNIALTDESAIGALTFLRVAMGDAHGEHGAIVVQDYGRRARFAHWPWKPTPISCVYRRNARRMSSRARPRRLIQSIS